MLDKSDSKFALLIDKNDNIEGIVTEKDFLKNLELLIEQNPLDKPIRLIMTHPVRTLTVDALHATPEFMLEHNIRRVPIMSRKNTLALKDFMGIVTEKTILQELVKRRNLPDLFSQHASKESKKTIGVLCSDGIVSGMLEKVFDSSQFILTHRLRYSNLSTAKSIEYTSELCDAIVIDIDNTPTKSWTSILKSFNDHPQMETVFVTYTPLDHEPNTIKVMQSLKGNSEFHIFEKPINVMAMVSELDKIWSSDESAA